MCLDRPDVDKGVKANGTLVQTNLWLLWDAAVKLGPTSWNASMFLERFQDEPDIARNAVQQLLADMGLGASSHSGRVFVPDPSLNRFTSAI